MVIIKRGKNAKKVMNFEKFTLNYYKSLPVRFKIMRVNGRHFLKLKRRIYLQSLFTLLNQRVLLLYFRQGRLPVIFSLIPPHFSQSFPLDFCIIRLKEERFIKIEILYFV